MLDNAKISTDYATIMPEKLSNTIPEKYGARSKSERAKLC